MAETEDAWAQLVSTTDNESEPVIIKKNKFIIGRSKVADLSLAGNKLASGTHCFIMRDQLGKAWLQDTSTNGTLLNMTEKITGERKELQHGDEITIVYKKEDPKYNVAYLFQDLELLQEEELDETQDISSELEQTMPYDVNVSDKSSPSPPKSGIKRHESDEEELPPSKKSKMESTCKSDTEKSAHDKETQKAETKTTKMEIESSKSDSVDGNKQVPTSGEKKDSGVTKDASKDPGSAEARDDMEENLMCIICQEIFHDCISLQPCLHSFCAGCYSEWMERSKECPSCRLHVDRINRNHMVNNLVEVYFKQHPEKRRPEADLKELDAKNKITKDMLKPPKPKKTMSEILDEEDDEEEENHSESDDYSDSDAAPEETAPAVYPPGYVAPVPFAFTGMTTGFGTPMFGGYKPPKTVCRQCPEYKDPVGPTSPVTKVVAAVGNIVSKAVEFMAGKTNPAGGDAGKETGEGTSTIAAAQGSGEGTSSGGGDQAKTAPVPVKYVCPATQIHILCACCLQPVPDRRAARSTDKEIPPQQCNLCFRAYCHQYWTCRKADCTGCLAEFRDLVFSKTIIPTLILQNATESNIFKTYLEEKNIDLQAVHQACMEKLDAGTWTSIDTLRGLKSNTIVCYSCGVRNFRDLVYNYRKEISNDQLPAYVTTRADCYWGRNCRTQRNKLHHAANFNHICDQSKF